MSRLGTPALVAGALTLALAPAAHAGTPATGPGGAFVDLDVNATPLASTAKKPVGMALDFSSFTGNRTGADNGTTNDIKLAFPAGAEINGGAFPRCELDVKDFSVCTAASRIGTGTAEGAVRAADGTFTFVPTQLAGYNGSLVNGKPTLIFLATAGGKTLAEVDFTISTSGGRPVLDDYVVEGGTPSPISISQFNLTVRDLVKKSGKGKKRKVTHFITTPRSCPKAGWTFTQTNTYGFGTLAASSTSPCVKLKG